MGLIGKKVQHNKFGEGLITEQDASYVSVKFMSEPETKRFQYVDKSHEHAIGFIGSSEMLDVKPQPVKYMVDSDRVKGLHVKENTVLISRSGTIGNMSFVNRTLLRK